MFRARRRISIVASLICSLIVAAVTLHAPSSEAVTRRCPTGQVAVDRYTGVFVPGSCFKVVMLKVSEPGWIYDSSSLLGPLPASKPFGKIEPGTSTQFLCQTQVHLSPVPGSTHWVLARAQAPLSSADFSPGAFKTYETKAAFNRASGWGWVSTEALIGARDKFIAQVPQCTPRQAAPAGTFHTPVPKITVDATAAPDLEPWLINAAQVAMEMYPALGDAFAYPNYAPPTEFSIVIDPTLTRAPGVTSIRDRKIRISPESLKSKPSSTSTVIHEITHIINDCDPEMYDKKTNGWVIEGLAYQAHKFESFDRRQRKAPGKDYLDGYGAAGAMFEYAEKKYAPGLIKYLFAATHEGTYTDAFWLVKTGHTHRELWQEFINSAEYAAMPNIPHYSPPSSPPGTQLSRQNLMPAS